MPGVLARMGDSAVTKAQAQLLKAAKRAQRYFDSRPAITMTRELLETATGLTGAIAAVELEEEQANAAANSAQLMDRR